MTSVKDFREFGKEMIDYAADYMENLRSRDAISSVKPGYLAELIPNELPEKPDEWKDILRDIERVIMPGVTHWTHPHFFGYFATAASGPSVLADILCGTIAGVGFSWFSLPASTELEMSMMDWIAKLLGLPEHFLFSAEGPGGGVIQGTASEATFVSMLTARSRHIEVRSISGNDVYESSTQFGLLVAYTSDQAHSSIEKSAMLSGVRVRKIETDENFSMKADVLRQTIKKDKENGLIPFHCTATLGTTNSCAFDNLKEIGEVCQEENLWLHVDAAYAGSAFACEEFRHYLTGIEYADSFNFNPHKWMLVNFDCSAMFLKNSKELVNAFNVDPLYLKHQYEDTITDYRHWQIPLGRRFRSLKIWFTLRLFGKVGIQNYIRNHVRLAKEFESLLQGDEVFEIAAPVVMGLVCFRMKGENILTEKLCKLVIDERKIFLVSTKLEEKFVLRLALVSYNTTSEDITFVYNLIKGYASKILKENN